MTAFDEHRFILEGFNQTELYQTARNAGIIVLPSTPKERIISYLLGEEEPPIMVHNLDSWRRGIMGFILEHWKKIETQLTCPAKSGDPSACFQCVDAQVVTCLVNNESDLVQIRVHRK